MSCLISLEEIARNLIEPAIPEGAILKIGKFDSTKENVIMLTDHKKQLLHNVHKSSKKLYDVRHLEILVHWDCDYSNTEAVADSIYQKIKDVKELQINDEHKILFCTMDHEASVSNPRSSDIFERTIDFVIYYTV